MKRKIYALAFILVLIIFAISGCEPEVVTPPAPQEDVITVSATVPSITIKDSEVTGYDYTKYFIIKKNDETITVSSSYIDASKVVTTAGAYDVVCTYQEVSAKVTVNVTKTIYAVTLSQEEITIKRSAVDSYDYKSLFVASIDGVNQAIDDAMITTNITNKAGTYNYTVTFGDVSKTLVVHVIPEENVEIIPSYKEVEIPINDLESFDWTKLFSLYVEGVATKVTAEMITQPSNMQVGVDYSVTLSYVFEETTYTETIKVKVVGEAELAISSKNIVTYPNGEYIDLTTLFVISKGEENIPVTSDMITGSIDYSKVGTNTITLTYQGVTKTATVEVQMGVIINYSKSDTITVVKGTNIDTYAFMNDFVILINGLKFTNISETYLDRTNVDFSAAGTYQATLTIPYNDKTFGLSGKVNFVNVTKTITYVVVENNYTISLGNELVTLPQDTTSYNVYSNLSVVINGRNQTLTENKTHVDIISCYVETLSDPLDYTSSSRQNVSIAVYVNGVNNDPVIVNYQVMIASNISIETNNEVIFAGATLYTRDLFTITADGENVPVTNDMISGKVDTFTPGIYPVTIDYLGHIETATVVVYDNLLKGTYHTTLRTIPETSTSEDDDETIPPTYQLGDLVINDDGTITVNGNPATVIQGIDEKTLIIKFANNVHTLYYDNGIIVLDPDNSIRLGFNENKRPLVYFNEALWEIEETITINSSNDHILTTTSTTYSIDTFRIKSVTSDDVMWYGLKIALVEKTSSDTVYQVTWGEVVYDESFTTEVGTTSSLTFENTSYPFTMQTTSVGKIKQTESTREYANKVFNGTIDGKSATLITNQYEGYELTVNGTKIFSVIYNESGPTKNVSVDYSTNTIFVQLWEDDSIYGYQFIVDLETSTFELAEGDGYLGKYKVDNMYIYLNGFGSGYINFDTSSYQKTEFTYQVNGLELKLYFQNTKPSFAYGKTLTLSISQLKNTLIVRESVNQSIVNKQFENIKVIDGAIVKINSFRVGKGSDSVAKVELYSNIEIITKDGVLDNTAKAKIIDTSRIRFNTPGFYQMAINVSVNGQTTTSYYAVQVVDNIYEGNEVVAVYGGGVIFNNNSLSIDKYGQAILNVNNITFVGSVTINEDSSFVVKAFSDDGRYVILTGTKVVDGLYLVTVQGSVAFADYYTKGSTNVSGIEGFVLRQITIGSNTTYILSETASQTGVIVDVETINDLQPTQVGAIIKVSNDGVDSYLKVLSWESATAGLQKSDSYRGSYHLDNNPDITLDGFGKATIGSASATYTLSGKNAIITTTTETKVYELNTSDNSYSIVQMQLDNSLLVGKVYHADYTYLCGSYTYTADTTFTFKANGVVTIVSTSSSHDDGEDSCEDDRYEPAFASKTGVDGRFSVSGIKLTITVNNITFVFNIDNVLKLDTLTCTQTTLSNSEHGGFKVGTVYSKQ